MTAIACATPTAATDDDEELDNILNQQLAGFLKGTMCSLCCLETDMVMGGESGCVTGERGLQTQPRPYFASSKHVFAVVDAATVKLQQVHMPSCGVKSHGYFMTKHHALKRA